MIRRPPRSTRTYTLFPTRRSSDLRVETTTPSSPGPTPARPCAPCATTTPSTSRSTPRSWPGSPTRSAARCPTAPCTSVPRPRPTTSIRPGSATPPGRASGASPRACPPATPSPPSPRRPSGGETGPRPPPPPPHGAMHLGAPPETDDIDPARECYAAGQGLGGIDAIVPAGELVHRFVEEAEREIDRLGALRAPTAR